MCALTNIYNSVPVAHAKPTATAARAVGADKDTKTLIAFTLGYTQAKTQAKGPESGKPSDKSAAETG